MTQGAVSSTRTAHQPLPLVIASLYVFQASLKPAVIGWYVSTCIEPTYSNPFICKFAHLRVVQIVAGDEFGRDLAGLVPHDDEWKFVKVSVAYDQQSSVVRTRAT